MKSKPTDSGSLKQNVKTLTPSQKSEVTKLVSKSPGVHRASTIAHHVSGLNEFNPSHTEAIQKHLDQKTDTGAMTQDSGGNCGYRS